MPEKSPLMIHLPATSLRFRVMMLVALAMLPVFGLTLYHASVERDRKLHELEGEAVRMAELSAGGIGKVIEGTRQTLLFLAHAEPVRAMSAGFGGCSKRGGFPSANTRSRQSAGNQLSTLPFRSPTNPRANRWPPSLRG